jgi:predicted HTH domain antitoxin
MEDVVIEISGDLAEALRVPPGEQAARLRRELAVRLYEKGLLSFGKARELARMTKWEFHLLLGEEGIVRRYDMEELGEDLKTLEALG